MFFFQHDIGEQEIEAVANAIRNGHITTGVCLQEFKDSLKNRFNLPGVELCSSGTSAIHLALYALGIGPGDEVITTPYVGVWTVNPILAVGATPIFADIDPFTYNLDPKSIRQRVTKRTKAILPVSVNGVPSDIRGMRENVPESVRIVSDDIEALGSTRQGKYVGEDIGNDISVGGFWVSKQVTTGGGGMVVSEDKEFLKKFEGLTRHGHGLVGDMWNQHFGFNAWMNDFQAAMGVVQVARFDEKQERLLVVKDKLDKYFRKVRVQECKRGDTATEFVYIIELPVGVDKKYFEILMLGQGVPTRPYFNNLMNVPHLARYASLCPVAESISKRTVALPYHWKLSDEDIEEIHVGYVNVLKDCSKIG